MKKNGKVGVGVYSSLFSFYHTLGDYHTNFDGEMEAIRLALEQLLLRPNSFEKTVLLSDSQAALQAIASAQPRDSRVAATRSLLMELQQNHKQICFQWIPSHCGIAGNEAADTLAKKGTKIVNTSNHNISFNSAKLHIKRKFKDEIHLHHQKTCEGKKWSPLLTPGIIPNQPRKETVATFRILTGHDLLAAHLHRLSILQSPVCIFCNEENSVMDWDHILKCCALQDFEYKTVGDLYWEVRRRMMMHQVSGH